MADELEQISDALDEAMEAIYARIGWRSLPFEERQKLSETLRNMFDAQLRLTIASVDQVSGEAADIVAALREATAVARSRADKLNGTRRAIEQAGTIVTRIIDLIPFG